MFRANSSDAAAVNRFGDRALIRHVSCDLQCEMVNVVEIDNVLLGVAQVVVKLGILSSLCTVYFKQAIALFGVLMSLLRTTREPSSRTFASQALNPKS